MNKEKYFIRRFVKVYKEGKSKYYWFNTNRYIEEASKFNFDSERIRAQIELKEEDEDKQIICTRTIDRVLEYCEGYIEKNGKDKSVTINTIKILGKALCDDEYAFLILIESNNLIQAMRMADDIFGGNDMKFIYGQLNNILYEVEASSYYAFKPGTEEDGGPHYDAQLQEIRREIDRRFWDNKEVRNKLYKIVEEEEEMTKSFSVPGVPLRWMECNPQIRYFDCVFDFIEESPELYERIKKGELSTIRFNFYPDEEECKARKAYFEKMNKNNYTFDRLYQNELVNTLQCVFENDFR